MTALTLEEVQELRRKVDCGCAECAPREELFRNHEALLDAAERVAREHGATTAAGATDEVAAFPAPLDAAAAPGARLESMLGTDAARARLAELAPAFAAAFGDDQGAQLKQRRFRAATLDDFQRWYRERGLHVNLKVMGDRLMYDFVGLIEPPTLDDA